MEERNVIDEHRFPAVRRIQFIVFSETISVPPTAKIQVVSLSNKYLDFSTCYQSNLSEVQENRFLDTFQSLLIFKQRLRIFM